MRLFSRGGGGFSKMLTQYFAWTDEGYFLNTTPGFSLGFWKGESRDSPLLKMVSPTKFW